jgi:UDP-N-acetylglucosamine 2-epimerase (hydrolysing)
MTSHNSRHSDDVDCKSRTLVFVTGTRADFGKIQPLAEASAACGFTVRYFVTGMHMLRQYGDTRLEVRLQASGDVYEFVNQSPGEGHDQILGKTMQGFGDWITEYPADLVIIHGDRVESLAIALVCSMRYIPCAHVEGGEVSGTIDELYRHCNSKLCRYHFVSSEVAARRLCAMGEDPADIFVIGSPELDIHGTPSTVDFREVQKHYDIEFQDFGIVIFHPVTSELDTIHEQTVALFRTLAASERRFVVILPNNDPGSDTIRDVIRQLPSAQFRTIPSMRFRYFSEMMKQSRAIIGNSSLGVREAPFLGIPSLDIGTRQSRRATAKSIFRADALDSAAIQSFLRWQWGKRYEPSDAFGNGRSSARFASILRDEQFWSRPKQKKFYEPLEEAF